MDTAVLVGDGVRLQNLTKAIADKVKRLRWDILLEEWQPMPRFREIDRRFWTVVQDSFTSPTVVTGCFHTKHRRSRYPFTLRPLQRTSWAARDGPECIC